MMELRPAPPWIVATIRVVQGDLGALGGAIVGTALALLLMMAIGVLVAWQTGPVQAAPPVHGHAQA